MICYSKTRLVVVAIALLGIFIFSGCVEKSAEKPTSVIESVSVDIDKDIANNIGLVDAWKFKYQLPPKMDSCHCWAELWGKTMDKPKRLIEIYASDMADIGHTEKEGVVVFSISKLGILKGYEAKDRRVHLSCAGGTTAPKIIKSPFIGMVRMWGISKKQEIEFNKDITLVAIVGGNESVGVSTNLENEDIEKIIKRHDKTIVLKIRFTKKGK